MTKPKPNLENILQVIVNFEKELKEYHCLFTEKKFEEALDNINGLIRGGETSDTSLASMLACKGDVLRQLGQPEEAEGAYLAASQSKPRHYGANMGLAELYIDQSRKAEAISVIHNFLKYETNQGFKESFGELLARAEKLK